MLAGVSAVTADVSFDVYLNSPILDKTKNYTTMIFNEQGFIDIDEMIVQEPSFQKIMADGVVTSDELREQTNRVIDLLHEVENRFSEEDQLLVKRLFAETNVLSVIYHHYSLQNIR